MITGPANVLSCPYCGGEKEVMSLASGNTLGGTVWSDTRGNYPMLPEASPIQQCPHCGKYYFLDQAKRKYSDDPDSEARSFMRLGTLTFSQLKEARKQMAASELSRIQRWVLNRYLFMAYNDCYRREPLAPACVPTEEEKELFATVISELLDGIEATENYEIIHAELLRESGRFEEAKAVLSNHTAEEDKWIVEAMLRHIEAGNTKPFLLIDKGEVVE